jgi:DNA-binding FadR family transcriptional regulator
VLAATGNRLLHLFAEPILVSINAESLQQRRTRGGYHRDVYQEHREIVAAIRAKDQQAARAVMSRHIGGLNFAQADHSSGRPFAGLCF